MPHLRRFLLHFEPHAPPSKRIAFYATRARKPTQATALPHDPSRVARPRSAQAAQATSRQEGHENVKQKLGYGVVARRITAAMVAAPIAIVTTYHLFQRLFFGVEQKHLVANTDEDARNAASP